MSDKPSDTIITITISPAQNGKRKILVSGAPEKEMPTVRAGTFTDLHRLIDEVWVELQKRKPQVVKVPSEKKAGSTKPANDAKEDESTKSTMYHRAPAVPVVKQGDDQSVAEKPSEEQPVIEHDWAVGEMPGAKDHDVPTEEEQLPLIEGDTTEDANESDESDDDDDNDESEEQGDE